MNDLMNKYLFIYCTVDNEYAFMVRNTILRFDVVNIEKKLEPIATELYFLHNPCCFDVGLALQTVVQHQSHIGSTSRACCDHPIKAKE